MKKYIILIGSVITMALASCGGNSDNNASAAKPAADTATNSDLTKNPDYQKGLSLVASNDCLTCHQVNGPATGPSYTDVANKYDNSDSTINMLANKIISGGSGHWGNAAMVSHPSLSKDDAKQMVKYILLLKTNK